MSNKSKRQKLETEYRSALNAYQTQKINCGEFSKQATATSGTDFQNGKKSNLSNGEINYLDWVLFWIIRQQIQTNYYQAVTQLNQTAITLLFVSFQNKITMKNIIIVLLSLFLFGCKKQPERTRKTTQSSNENHISLTKRTTSKFSIGVSQSCKKNIHHTLKLNGTIDVPPQNLGFCQQCLWWQGCSPKLLPGMHFRKGEILVTLEDNRYIQLQQDYLTTQSTVAKCKWREEYNHQKELNQSKASSIKFPTGTGQIIGFWKLHWLRWNKTTTYSYQSQSNIRQ